MQISDVLPSRSLDGRASIPNLESRRFLFVTGKGGVGKTTLSAALALSLAARGRRVLIAMCHTKERLSAILGTPPVGNQVTRLAPGVWGVNIDPELALTEYGHLVLKVRSLTNAVFNNRYTKTFFRAVPGLHEWAMLGKAWFHTTELDDDGSSRFDTVILDAPATGHGLDMLRVPRVILDVAPPGVLRRDAETAWSMFTDPSRSGVVVVTLPEELPTTETIELVRGIEELGLPALTMFVNGVVPPLFSPEERSKLLVEPKWLEIRAPERAQGGTAAIVAGARRALRERVQAESISRLLDATDLPVGFLPFLLDDASTAEGTRRLASLIDPRGR
jgi:anion-transporting  ArsA/GET3 family ATPase